MWYLYSLIFCYVIGVLLIVKMVNQAKHNKTLLTGTQTWFLVLAILILMSIPLLNVIYGIDTIYRLIFNPYELEDEIDDLIDNIKKTI